MISKLDKALEELRDQCSGQDVDSKISVKYAKQATITLFKEIVESSNRYGICPTKALLDKIGEL